jgi:hypothetical protein
LYVIYPPIQTKISARLHVWFVEYEWIVTEKFLFN